MDGLTRTYIREQLTYQFAETSGGAEAREWEATIRRGAPSAGAPQLNPLARASHRANTRRPRHVGARVTRLALPT
jgi:hypothetical protein